VENVHAPMALLNPAMRLIALLPDAVVSRAILGGGAIRSGYDDTPIRDYDLFFRSDEDFNAALAEMESLVNWSRIEAPQCPRTPSFTCGRVTVNLVGFRFRSTVRETAEAFDFRCCGHAISLADLDDYYQVPDADYDAQARILNFLNLQKPQRVLKRAVRYINAYDYAPSEDFLARMPECWSVVDNEPGEY
jgi:hypothetical protein